MKTYLFIFFGLLAILSVGLFSSNASVPSQPMVLPPGADLLEVSGTLDLDLPAGFFGPGSNAVLETISVVGAKVQTRGAFELGTASLVLERLVETTFPWPAPDSMRCDVEIADLEVVGAQLLQVTSHSKTEGWSVSAKVEGGPTTDGFYDISRPQSGSGLVTGVITAPLHLSFTNGKEKVGVALGMTTFTLGSGTWVDISASPSAGLAVPGLPCGVAITATLTAPTMSLSLAPAGIDTTRPGPSYVDPTAVIDSGVASLGRYCAIGPNAIVGSGVVVGPYARIAGSVNVGSGAVIGDRAIVGEGATIGSNAYIGSSVVISPGVVILADAIVERNAVIESNCTIGVRARVGSQSVFQKGVVLGADAIVEGDVHIGSFASISANVRIPSGVKIGSNAQQTTSMVRCTRSDGTVEFRSLPTSSWGAGLPDVVIQSNDGMTPSSKAIVTPAGILPVGSPIYASHDPVDPSTPPGGMPGLAADIGSDIAPPQADGTGGTGHPYSPTHMCGWFAEQLRQKLADKGYDTTFTGVWRRNPKARWYNFAPTWIEGHALVDIHWPEGTVTWIEAQLPNGEGIDSPTGGLDGDGDGVVEAWDGHRAKKSDGDMRVEVYGSRAEAEAAGTSVPGN